MCRIASRMAGVAFSLAVATVSLSSNSVSAASVDHLQLITVCHKEARPDQCETTLSIDVSRVTQFRFSVWATGYDKTFFGDKHVILQYWLPASSTWACVGAPCTVLVVKNRAPDAFGWEHYQYMSPKVVLPPGQRLPTTQWRIVERDGESVGILKTMIELFTP